jgi:uncharacterized protein YheU (UPF0270 family)
MRVHHSLLSASALRAVLAKFVTRDGTDHSDVNDRLAAVIAQLEAGSAELHFDGETRSCNIVQARIE